MSEPKYETREEWFAAVSGTEIKPVYALERDHRNELMQERANGRLNGIKECNAQWVGLIEIIQTAAAKDSGPLNRHEANLVSVTLDELKAGAAKLLKAL